MKTEENLDEILEAFEDDNIPIIGISEVKRLNETVQIIKNNHLLAHTGYGGQRGIGFIVKNEWVNNIIEFKGISEKLAVLAVQIGTRKLRIIQVYASNIRVQ